MFFKNIHTRIKIIIDIIIIFTILNIFRNFTFFVKNNNIPDSHSEDLDDNQQQYYFIDFSEIPADKTEWWRVGTNEYYEDSFKIPTGEDKITLREVKDTKINLYPDGGTLPAATEIPADPKTGDSFPLPTPEKGNFTFEGWVEVDRENENITNKDPLPKNGIRIRSLRL